MPQRRVVRCGWAGITDVGGRVHALIMDRMALAVVAARRLVGSGEVNG